MRDRHNTAIMPKPQSGRARPWKPIRKTLANKVSSGTKFQMAVFTTAH